MVSKKSTNTDNNNNKAKGKEAPPYTGPEEEQNEFRFNCGKCYARVKIISDHPVVITKIEAICTKCAMLLKRALPGEKEDLERS